MTKKGQITEDGDAVTELTVAEQREMESIAEGSLTPAALLAHAISQGIDPDGIEKLALLMERMEDRQARRDFSAAMLLFQNKCPVIFKHKKGDKAPFAPLETIKRAIQPHLQECGLSVSQTTSQVDSDVVVDTTIAHTSGHSETSTCRMPMSSPMTRDGRAVMNPAQQMGSAISYARRYGLMLALNIVTGDEDDDGAAAGGQFIDEHQVLNLEALMGECVNLDAQRFLKYMGVDQLAHIPAAAYRKAVRVLEQKRRESTK